MKNILKILLLIVSIFCCFTLLSCGDKDEKHNQKTPPPVVSLGNQVGDLCYGFEMDVFDENGITGQRLDPTTLKGKITIINFWGTWCSGCIAELPYFDQIATDYKDSVTVVAVHTSRVYDTAPSFVNENYKDSDMIFTVDSPIDPSDPYSDEYYFKLLGGGDAYPISIILDENGVIIKTIFDSVTYDRLKTIIEEHYASKD